nr:hypothetical protein [uncultured Chitinophaga sp.]
MKISLGDFILDRTESLNDEHIKKYFIERNDDKISRLLDSEQYLLEGSRGVGKTMLMKAAMLRSQADFGSNSILPVWISFEESIRLERISIADDSIDPFLQWTMGKILYETLAKLEQLRPINIDKLNKRLSSIFSKDFSGNYEKYAYLLNEYIKFLEKGNIKNVKEIIKSSPSQELINVLDNPQTFKEFLLNLIKDLKLKRIVFLFDEAAHVFSFSQQEKFFTFFKSLRDPKIACKAAVYPGITNYGKYFERGQDAKELKIAWNPMDPADIRYIKNIIKKRIQAYNGDYWSRLSNNVEVIDTICICSNGNPRFAFHIIDELENSKAFKNTIKVQLLINAIRSVFSTKWKEFDTLKQRLVKYYQYINEGEFFVKDVLLPNLRLWNEKQREKRRKLSLGFYISTKAYDQLEKVFSVLSYSNIINIDHSKKSLGKSKYGFNIAINPSILYTDLIIKDSKELRNTSTNIEYNQAYFETTGAILALVDKLRMENEFKCTKCDFKTTQDSFKFCPKCGSKMDQAEEESLYKILRSHSISNLKLSSRMIDRLKHRFKNIGELYDADENTIRMKYIQDVRVTVIKSAVIEYMSG